MAHSQEFNTPVATATRAYRSSNRNKVFTYLALFLGFSNAIYQVETKEKKVDGLSGDAVHVVQATSKCCENGKTKQNHSSTQKALLILPW